MVLLRVLLLFLVFYLVLRLLGRLLFGNYYAQRSSSGDNKKKDTHREGDVYIKYKPDQKEKIIPEKDGEYVKFEEMDDDDS